MFIRNCVYKRMRVYVNTPTHIHLCVLACVRPVAADALLFLMTETIVPYDRNYCSLRQKLLFLTTETIAPYDRNYCSLRQKLLFLMTETHLPYDRNYCSLRNLCGTQYTVYIHTYPYIHWCIHTYTHLFISLYAHCIQLDLTYADISYTHTDTHAHKYT